MGGWESGGWEEKFGYFIPFKRRPKKTVGQETDAQKLQELLDG